MAYVLYNKFSEFILFNTISAHAIVILVICHVIIIVLTTTNYSRDSYALLVILTLTNCTVKTKQTRM